MQYPIIDLISQAYLNNGWTGLDIPDTITYEPIQMGSGDPSPDNVRPILPATTLNIGGVDVPIYGGTLDVTTGVLTVDHKSTSLTNMSPTSIGSSNIPVWTKNTGDAKPFPNGESANIIAEAYTAIRFNGLTATINSIAVRDNAVIYVNTGSANIQPSGNAIYELATPITYQLTPTEVETTIGSKDDIAHRLKLPLPHYFPHPVIDALQRAAAGTQTADDTEILRHYLTPLGIGGI